MTQAPFFFCARFARKTTWSLFRLFAPQRHGGAEKGEAFFIGALQKTRSQLAVNLNARANDDPARLITLNLQPTPDT